MTKSRMHADAVVIDLRLARPDGMAAEIAGIMQELILALPIDLVAVAYDGRIVAANISHTVHAFAGRKANDALVGVSFETLLDHIPLDDDIRRDIRDQLVGVLHGDMLSATLSHSVRGAGHRALTVHAVRVSGPMQVMLVALMAERGSPDERRARRAEQGRILRAQDEERRRIARELHDGTSQHIALAQVMLETVREARTLEAMEDACGDIETALCTAQRQMRTLSYVLHPPELEAGGIVDALGSFLKGFARRSGLSVRFQNLAGFLRPAADLEIALYRVAQEALVNVGKHAFASTVEVRLRRVSSYLALEIEDDGIGIPHEIIEGRMREAVGVGLAGMRERVEGLGGMFCVERRLNGTHIGAYFPQRRNGDGDAARPGPVRCPDSDIPQVV